MYSSTLASQHRRQMSRKIKQRSTEPHSPSIPGCPTFRNLPNAARLPPWHSLVQNRLPLPPSDLSPAPQTRRRQPRREGAQVQPRSARRRLGDPSRKQTTRVHPRVKLSLQEYRSQHNKTPASLVRRPVAQVSMLVSAGPCTRASSRSNAVTCGGSCSSIAAGTQQYCSGLRGVTSTYLPRPPGTLTSPPEQRDCDPEGLLCCMRCKGVYSTVYLSVYLPVCLSACLPACLPA